MLLVLECNSDPFHCGTLLFQDSQLHQYHNRQQQQQHFYLFINTISVHSPVQGLEILYQMAQPIYLFIYFTRESSCCHTGVGVINIILFFLYHLIVLKPALRQQLNFVCTALQSFNIIALNMQRVRLSGCLLACPSQACYIQNSESCLVTWFVTQSLPCYTDSWGTGNIISRAWILFMNSLLVIPFPNIPAVMQSVQLGSPLPEFPF